MIESLASQLQFLCTPAEYEKILGRLSRKWGALPGPDRIAAYWRVIPFYTYAVCPLCRFSYREQADTYSLRGWGGANYLWRQLFGLPEEHPAPMKRCPHFLGVAKFYNLHNQTPDELDWFQQDTGEVPVVTPWLLPEDLKSYVVFHPLPICRIERGRFVPRYTVFALTYFSQQPDEVMRRIYEQESDDPEFTPLVVVSSQFEGPGLAEWAARGRLGWLDLAQSGTPLRIGPGEKFPDLYQALPGSRDRYVWNVPGSSYR